MWIGHIITRLESLYGNLEENSLLLASFCRQYEPGLRSEYAFMESWFDG